MNVTLIYAGPGELERVVKPLAELAEHGLTTDFAIVSSDGACLSFGRREGRHESVTSYLAAFKLGLVRLVRLSFGAFGDDSQVEAINSLSTVLRSTGIPVIAGSVTVLRAGTTTSTSSMDPFWNFNMVLTPDDGVREAQFIEQDVVSVEQQQMIAVGAVALIGGLWRWLEQGPFDDAEHAGVGNHNGVMIGRVVTRLVDAGDIAERAVAWAMTPAGQGPAPDGFVRHGDNEAAASELVDHLAPTTGASPLGFAYVAHVVPPAPAPKSIGPVAAIAMFWRLVLQELIPVARARAMDWWTEIQGRVEEAVQQRTFGADSEIVVRLRRLDHLDRADVGEDRAEALKALPRLELNRTHSTPRTWELFTTTVLSCADGGSIPGEMSAARPAFHGRDAVIADLTVLAHTDLADETNRGFVLSADDIELLGLASAAPDGAIGQVDPLLVESVLSRLPNATPAAKSPVLAPPAAPKEQAERTTSGDVAAGIPQSPTADPRVALASRLRTWVGKRQRTLMWRLAERLVVAQNLALDDLQSTQDALMALRAQMGEAGTELERSRRRFRRHALVLALVLVALVALAVVGFVAVSLTVGVVLLAVFGVGLFASMFGFVRLAADRVQLERRLRRHAELPAALMERRRHAASEYARLSSLYDQFQDWAPIVASAMYRPWGSTKPEEIEPWTLDTGVSSFVTGHAHFSQSRMTRSALGVAQRVRTAGWLGRAYSARRERWLDDYNELTAQVGGAARTPEADGSMCHTPLVTLEANVGFATTTVYSPRAQFRCDLSAGAYADAYRSDQTSRLRSLVQEDDPAELVETVSSSIPGLDGDGSGRTVADFLRPVVEYPDVPSLSTFVSPWARGEAVERSICGISSVIPCEIPRARKQLAVTGVDKRLVFAAFRLDLTKPLLPNETRLVVDADPERQTLVEVGSDSDVG